MHGLVNFPATAYSLPDGLGDDLVIEVHDSKGKYCGNAVLQVADIAEESVLTMTFESSLYFCYFVGRLEINEWTN